MVELAEYQALRVRPLGRSVMTQRWRNLLFAHFPLPANELKHLIPPQLSLDTFPNSAGEEQAWVGLVPFRMEGVTPTGFPEIPGIHTFPETNVRTYVHFEGRKPGVWFFSLDAANRLACKVARTFFSLPYHEARMTVEQIQEGFRYRSNRHRGARFANVDCAVGESIASPIPGSLEFFLAERYLLYSQRKGKLFTGRVFHDPYPIREVKSVKIEESLVTASGMSPRPFQHFLFSTGVDVEVFGLNPVNN